MIPPAGSSTSTRRLRSAHLPRWQDRSIPAPLLPNKDRER